MLRVASVHAFMLTSWLARVGQVCLFETKGGASAGAGGLGANDLPSATRSNLMLQLTCADFAVMPSGALACTTRLMMRLAHYFV
jgi:hypothetical protein